MLATEMAGLGEDIENLVREQCSLLQTGHGQCREHFSRAKPAPALFPGADGLGGVFVQNERLGLAVDDGFVDYDFGNILQ